MFHRSLHTDIPYPGRRKRRLERTVPRRTVVAGDAVSKCPREPRAFLRGHLLEFYRRLLPHKSWEGLPEATE